MTEEKKEEIKVPSKFKDLVKQIEDLSVLELADLVKVLEEKFGVSAMPMAVASANGSAANGEAGESEEKSEFDIELKNSWRSKNCCY